MINVDLQCWTWRPCRADERHGYPAARRCHSLVQLGQAAYICGGYDGHTIFGDLWRLDLSMMQWTRLPAVLPEPVYFHSAGVTDAGQFISSCHIITANLHYDSKEYL